MLMLRRTLNARIGRTGLAAGYVAKLWTASILGAATGWALKIVLPAMHPVFAALFILGPYGIVFFVASFALRIPEVSTSLARLRRLL